jgi:hypothetical protein
MMDGVSDEQQLTLMGGGGLRRAVQKHASQKGWLKAGSG